MILRLLFLLFTLGPIAAPLQGGWVDDVAGFFRKTPPQTPPKIRVLVVNDRDGVVLEVKGKYKIYDPHTGEHISTRFVGKRKFIQAINDGLKWGEEFPGVYQLMIVPDERNTTTIVDGIEYRGPIYIYDIGGFISVINEVNVEDYLSSILAKRYKEDTPSELLAAVAIAARTGAYYAVQHPKSQYWSIDAMHVGYQGSAVTDSGSRVERAIYETRYMVMSNTAPGEEQVNAFPAEWKREGKELSTGDRVLSRITLAEASALAQKGEHAAQILGKAFPGIKIDLIHYATEKR